MTDKPFCAVGFNNKKKIYYLQLFLLFTNRKVYFFNTIFFKRNLILGWFIKNKRIIFRDNGIGEIKGLYYEVSRKALELTQDFFDKFISETYLLSFMNKLLKTNKYECYLKKSVSYDIFENLAGLYLLKEYSLDRRIILIDTPITRFSVDDFLKDNKINLEIHWISFNKFFWIELFLYYLIVIKTVIRNGIVFKLRKKIKLYKEAVHGSSRPIFRDDCLIDNNYFKKEDIIFYSRYKEHDRDIALCQVKSAGYATVDLKRCKLNVKNYFLLFIRFYLIIPFRVFFVAYYEKARYQEDFILKFYLESLHHFLFLTNYDVKCHISSCDSGEVAETIIMNIFGCKNILYHWSDKTPYKCVLSAFSAHNVCYLWGPIHYEFMKEYYYYDKTLMVGCIFLKPYFDYLEKLGKSHRNSNKIKILICDNSFENSGAFSENFYLDFLDLAIKLLNDIPDADLIFRPKNNINDLNSFTCENRKIYFKKTNFLNSSGRFICCDMSFQIGSLIALTDIVITMGLTSPTTIALVLHKEAVYYDRTGNNQHPMTKYKNSVVFDDKDRLIEHIKRILEKKKSVFDNIDTELLNSYDPFRDSKALDRLIEAVYKDTEIFTRV